MAFDITPFGALFDLVGKVLERVIPDPVAKANAQLELAKLQQSGELAQLTADTQLAQGQLDVDKAEATNQSVFVSGWRPFIGWVCGSGLVVQFIASPLITFAADLCGKHVVVPTLDLGTLMTLLFGMLGLGAYRTAEKIKGTK